MESKRDYRASIKTARKEFKNRVRLAYSMYRFDVKKNRLLYKQSVAKGELKEMGVPNRQIPVTIIESKAYKVKVRVL